MPVQVVFVKYNLENIVNWYLYLFTDESLICHMCDFLFLIDSKIYKIGCYILETKHYKFSKIIFSIHDVLDKIIFKILETGIKYLY